MSEAIVNDELPRQLAYPFNRIALEDHLFELDWPEQVGLYFLYISGKQLDHYDPLLSRESRYPVLVLDNGPPPLNGNVLAHIGERQREEAARKTRDPDEVELSGSQRAQAQLEGAESRRGLRSELAEPVLPPVSLIVLPVKARMRRRVTEALETQGLRAIKNWLACPVERKAQQRPLVLVFDEEADRIIPKFAEEPSDPAAPRLYR